MLIDNIEVGKKNNFIKEAKLDNEKKTIEKSIDELFQRKFSNAFKLNFNLYCKYIRLSLIKHDVNKNDIYKFISDVKQDALIFKDKYKIPEKHILGAFPKLTLPLYKFIKEQKISLGFIWMFLIDSEKININGIQCRKVNSGIKNMYGPLSFENEKGYIQGMYRGFSRALETLGKKLSPEMYVSFHDNCVKNVKRVSGENFGKGFIDRYWKYGLRLKNGKVKVSDESWEELILDKIIAFKSKEDVPPQYAPFVENFSEKLSYLAQYDKGAVGASFKIKNPQLMKRLSKERVYRLSNCFYFEELCIQELKKNPEQSFYKLVLRYIDNLSDIPQIREFISNIDRYRDIYFQVLQNEEETFEDKQLGNIVNFCRGLEISHVLPDGNARTIINILLNKLLLERGFSPVVMKDSYVFDGYYSKREMMDLLKVGMNNFNLLKKHYRLYPKKLLN